jgi:hypothetical protein
MSGYINWDDQSRLRYDPGARAQFDRQSASPLEYITDNTGYRWCQTPGAYATMNSAPMHFPKQYRNACTVSEETPLIHSNITNPRLKKQLLTRPYLGAYLGAGQSTSNQKDLETELIYGLDTRGGPRRACDVLSGVSINRFECLPEFGNPQRVKHIVPVWIRGGDNTRDYVRRVNYEAKMKNCRTSNLLNQLHK